MLATSLLFTRFLVPPPEGLFILLFVLVPIAAYTFYGLCCTYHHLAAERKLVQRCCNGLRSVAAEKRMIEAADVENWIKDARIDNIVHKGIAAIWANRMVSNPDLNAIASMLVQGEAARLSFPRLAPNLLLLTGLLGTVVGLAGTVGSLGPTVTAAGAATDPSELARQLGAALLHMRSAFACTFWGIIASLASAAACRWLAKRQSDLLTDVQDFCLRAFAPQVLPPSQNAQLDHIRIILQQSGAFVARVSQVMDEASVRFAHVLETSGKQMADSVAELRSVAGDMNCLLTKVAGDVRSSAETLQASSEALKGYHADLRNAYVELRNLFNESQRELSAQVEGQLQKISELQAQVDSSAQQTISRLDQTSEKLSSATVAFVEAGERVVITNDSVVQHVDAGFENLKDGLRDTLEEHRGEMGRVDTSLLLIAERFDNLTQRLDPRLLPQEEWNRVRNALDACIAEWHSSRETHTGSGDFTPLLRELHAAVSSLQQVAAKLLAPHTDMADAAANERLDAIHEAILEINPREELRSVRSAVDALRTDIHGHDMAGSAAPPPRRAFRIRLFRKPNERE